MAQNGDGAADASPDRTTGPRARTMVVVAEDGAAIPVSLHGDGGPLIVLVHGWSCGRTFWRGQVEPLAAAGYRVAVPDLPGHGDAASVLRSRWSMADYGADIRAIVDALGAEEATLVGHSMGGAVVVEAALLLGRSCRRIIGVDTFTAEAFYAARPATEIADRQALFASDFAGVMRKMVTDIVPSAASPALVAEIADRMAATPLATALGVLEALLAWDVVARLPAPDVPVVTLNSAMLARQQASIDLPGLDVRLMEDVGHFPMLEAPEAFNVRLLELLRA